MSPTALQRATARTLAGAAMVLLALVAPGVSSAAEHCVSDAAGLKQALMTSRLSRESDRILLQSGSYALGAGGLVTTLEVVESLRIEGGYGPGCATRSGDAAATVLDGEGVGQMAFAVCGDLTLERLSLTGFTGTDAISLDGNSYLCWSRRSVTLRDAIVTGNGGSHALYFGKSLGEARLSNVLVHGNTASTAAVKFQLTGTPSLHAAHVTIAGNAGTGLLVAQTGAQLHLWNSLVFGNAVRDIEVQGAPSSPPLLVSSSYGTLQGPLSAASAGVDQSDPLFTDAAGGDFSLGNGSPARETGAWSVMDAPALDLAGMPRWQGLRPDRGAYESAHDAAQLRLVTSTADSGAGSLRQALLDANASGVPSRITFALGNGCGPQVVTLASALPAVTGTVLIDGLAQPGAVAGTAGSAFDATVCVVLKASGVPAALPHGLAAAAGGTLAVRGLAFTGFVDAVALDGGNDHLVAGSRFDGHPSVPQAFGGNRIGVRVGGATKRVLIGGQAASQRNLVSGTLEAAIKIDTGATGAMVVGNFIGLAASGGTAGGNAIGMVTLGSGTQVRDNFISGNAGAGLVLAGSGSRVHGNWIGLGTGMQPVGNAYNGVHIYGSHHVVGGKSGRGNAIAHNAWAGVFVDYGINNEVAGNRIFGNDTAGEGWLGLDLNLKGPDANDAGDLDSGANGITNHPLVTGVQPASNARYSVDWTVSGPQGGVTIEAYVHETCEAHGRGEPGTPVLAISSYVTAAGSASGTLLLPQGVPSGSYLSLVATSPDGSSEPSPCVQAPWITDNVALSALAPSTGTLSPGFAPDSLVYTLSVPHAVDAIAFSATADDPLAEVRIEGELVPAGATSSPISLAVGINPVKVEVTARDGVTVGSYHVTVTRGPNLGAHLSALSITPGELSPAFDPGTLQYALSVDYADDTVMVAALPLDPAATLRIAGNVVGHGMPTPVAVPPGNSHFVVEITAADGSVVRGYNVGVTRKDSDNARLTALAPSVGQLAPAFQAHLLNYTLELPPGADTVALTAVAEEPDATVAIGGQPVAYGSPSQAIPVPFGSTELEVLVTAPDGVTQRSYRVTVLRALPEGDAIFDSGFED